MAKSYAASNVHLSQIITHILLRTKISFLSFPFISLEDYFCMKLNTQYRNI
jgi:hypothetical protein